MVYSCVTCAACQCSEECGRGKPRGISPPKAPSPNHLCILYILEPNATTRMVVSFEVPECPDRTLLSLRVEVITVITLVFPSLFALCLGFIDSNDTTIKLAPIQCLNSFIRCVFVHRNKPKTTRGPTLHVLWNVAIMHNSELLKDFRQCISAGVKGQVSNE